MLYIRAFIIKITIHQDVLHLQFIFYFIVINHVVSIIFNIFQHLQQLTIQLAVHCSLRLDFKLSATISSEETLQGSKHCSWIIPKDVLTPCSLKTAFHNRINQQDLVCLLCFNSSGPNASLISDNVHKHYQKIVFIIT